MLERWILEHNMEGSSKGKRQIYMRDIYIEGYMLGGLVLKADTQWKKQKNILILPMCKPTCANNFYIRFNLI